MTPSEKLVVKTYRGAPRTPGGGVAALIHTATRTGLKLSRVIEIVEAHA